MRATENYIQGLLLNPKKQGQAEAKPARVVDANVREAEDQLRRALGLRVQIEDKQGKGKVIIEYNGVDDFRRDSGGAGEVEKGISSCWAKTTCAITVLPFGLIAVHLIQDHTLAMNWS